MDDCIFCKIIKGEIPCNKFFEDEKFIAFLDIHPVAKGHSLIIPKEHFVWMQETPDDIVSDAFVLSKKIMNKMLQGLGVDYVQVSVVGKDVPHFHIHLIPRKLADDIHSHQAVKYEEGEVAELINKLKD